MGFFCKLLIGLFLSQELWAQQPADEPETNSNVEEGTEKVASANRVRRFHEVLEELLAEFGHDVRSGQINGLKNLAIRRIEVSDTLPRSYGNYVELLVAERIRENSKIRLINCIPCKTKTSRIADKQIVITSPQTNMAEMKMAAEQLGIEYFMDVILVYHTTHMVMAFQVFNTDSKELTYARTYNSETIKSKFQKLAVDYKQVIKSRPSDEYVPDWRYLFSLGGASVPNVSSGVRESSMLTIQLRATEKFNNRRSEFGMLGTLNISTSSLLSEYPSTKPDGYTSTTADPVTELTPTPFTQAIGLFGLYCHNFMPEIENFDRVRYGINGAAGLHLATGYIAPTLRAGVDILLGKKFIISVAGMYVTNANILLDNEFVKSDGGVGADAVLSYSF